MTAETSESVQRVARLERDPRLLMLAQTVSTTGDALLMVAVPLMVLDVSGSAAQVGIVVVLTQLPDFLGFLARPLRDRFAAKTILVVGDAVRCLAVVAVAVCLGAGVSSMPVVYALLTLTSLMTAITLPVRSDFITMVVPPTQLLRFNSYDRTLEALAVAIGAGVAGFLFDALPIWGNFALDGVSFLLSGLLVALLATVGNTRAASPDEGAEGGTDARPRAHGLRRLVAPLRDRLVALLLVGEFLTALAFGAFLAVFVVYVREGLGASGAVYGALEMVQAAAASLTGVLLGKGVLKLSERGLPVAGYLGMGLSVIVLGVVTSVPIAFAMMVGLGAANILYAIGVRTAFQRTVAADGLIEVFAAEAALSRLGRVAGASTGAAAVAFAEDRLGVLLAATGALMVISALLARTALWNRTKDLEIKA